MYNIALAASLLLGSYILFSIINNFISSRYHAHRAKQLGCKPAFLKPNKWPFGLDQIWQLLQADKRNEVPSEVLKILRAAGHSTVEMRAPNTSIMTTDPKNIQAILATQFEEFDLGERRRGYFLPLLGNGIFTGDGQFWSHSRALLRPQFAREQVSKLDLLENHVQLMFKHLEVQSSRWTPELELSALFFRLTMDSATEFLFGQSANSQISALPGWDKDKPSLQVSDQEDLSLVGRAFDTATHGLGVRARLGPLYQLYNPKSFRESCRVVHQFADRYVQLALQKDKSRSSSSKLEAQTGHNTGKYVFLDELVNSTRDPIELRSQLLNILLAGRDTTAGLLGWTFYLLARHPDIYRKLRSTVIETFGNYDSLKNFSFASLKACSYLQHVMNEVLRLYPSVPINTRTANRDTTIPRGGGRDGLAPVYIRKGQSVGYSVHVMHRRKDLWGEDAEEFRPDRWANHRHGWEFLPFNGGPRICLGQQFALTEAGYVIARMLQRFDQIENLDFTTEVKFQYSVTSAPLGVNVRLRRAAS